MKRKIFLLEMLMKMENHEEHFVLKKKAKNYIENEREMFLPNSSNKIGI